MTAEQRAEIVARIGPIRRTLEVESLSGGCLLLCGGAGVLLVLLCLLSPLVREWTPDLMLGMIVLLALGPLLALPLFGLHRRWPETDGDCLVIAERGLAEVRSGEVSFLLWAELGVQWRPLPVAFDAAHGVDPIVLLLERQDGTRFRLRTAYPGVRAVRLLIGQYLRRQQSQRAALAPHVASDELRVTSDRPAPGIFGPWTGSDAEYVIGPVRQVGIPRPDIEARLRRQVRLPFALGLFTSVLLLLVGLAGCVLASGGIREVPCAAAVSLVVVALAGLAASFSYRSHWFGPLRSFLLLGEYGVAIWHPDGSRVVPWDDLGTNWRLDPDITSADRAEVGPGILLKLRHADGPCFFITDLYENALLVVARVREELQRVRPVDRPRRALRRRGPASKAIRAPAHFSETPPLSSVPPVQSPAREDGIGSGVGRVEFVCAPPYQPNLLVGCVLFPVLGSTGLFRGELIFCGLFLWLLAAVLLLARMVRETPVRWLVGTEGIALEDAAHPEVLRWDDLGVGWRVFFLDRGGNVPPQLLFLLADGTELSVPPHYEGVERLAALVRAELARSRERPAPEEP
jgi:hypothetical protein